MTVQTFSSSSVTARAAGRATLPGQGRYRRIAVFRALQLGDMLCAVPALRALRAGEPQAHITLIGLPWAAAFVQRFGAYLDGFLPFPGAPGLVEQPSDADRLAKFMAQARDSGFDLAIQLHGSGLHTNALVKDLHAAVTAGFDGGVALDHAMPWPDALPESARFVALMESLGYVPQGLALEFPVNATETADAVALLRQLGLQAGAYVCLHPGARLRSRRWPVERFAAVARALALDGLPVVLTGTREEQPLAQALAQHARVPLVNLCGRTSLGVLAALLGRARLLVCNDTGVSHIAAALGTPSVVVACGSDVGRWAPLDRTRHHVLADLPACRPCMFEACPYGHACAMAIAADEVVTAARRMMQGGRHAA